MKFRGGEFSTGTTGNFQPELTICAEWDRAALAARAHACLQPRTEWTLFSLNDPCAFSLSDADMRARVTDLLGRQAATMIDLYRKLNPEASPSDIYFLIVSDYRYGAPTMIIAQRRAALGKGPVYLYYFTWETPVQGGRLKSPHTMEIPFAS